MVQTRSSRQSKASAKATPQPDEDRDSSDSAVDSATTAPRRRPQPDKDRDSSDSAVDTTATPRRRPQRQQKEVVQQKAKPRSSVLRWTVAAILIAGKTGAKPISAFGVGRRAHL
ncbi:hypothetical protein HK104_004226 [Borealophlyctis nickersoniae]|nr:hypothetical protein HK104_004226 [Borealophlyctis nickersoniae]